MDHNAFIELLQVVACLSTFGFVPLTVWIVNKAKLDRLKIERDMQRGTATPQDAPVLAELKALRREIAEMNSTSHQFDLSFDETLSRLEGRVHRIETKSAAGTTTATQPEEVQRAGRS